MKSVLLLFQFIYQKLWSVGPLQQKIKLPSPNTKLQKKTTKNKNKKQKLLVVFFYKAPTDFKS